MKSLKFNLNNFDYKRYDRMEKIVLENDERQILEKIFNNMNVCRINYLLSISCDAFRSLKVKGIINFIKPSSVWVRVSVPSVLFIEGYSNPVLVIFREKEIVSPQEEFTFSGVSEWVNFIDLSQITEAEYINLKSIPRSSSLFSNEINYFICNSNNSFYVLRSKNTNYKEPHEDMRTWLRSFDKKIHISDFDAIEREALNEIKNNSGRRSLEIKESPALVYQTLLKKGILVRSPFGKHYDIIEIRDAFRYLFDEL